MPVEVEVKARRITPADINAINEPGENKAPVYNNVLGKFEWRDVGSPGGGGDMLKAVYDANGNGIVENSERLEGYSFSQTRDHVPRIHGSECHTATFLTTCDKYTKAAQDALGIDAAALEGQDLAGTRNHVPQVHGNECHTATFLTTCDKYTKAAQDALGIDAATLGGKSPGTGTDNVAYYDAWGRVVDTSKIGGATINATDIASKKVLYVSGATLVYRTLQELMPAIDTDGKLILTGAAQIGTKTSDLANLWDKTTRIVTSDLEATEFNQPNKIPTLDASIFLDLSQIVGNVPGLNAAGDLVLTAVGTQVGDLTTLWDKSTKLVTSAIDDAEFNVASKLLKLDASAKVAYAQMPAIGGTATCLVAATDSQNKDKADYVCDGIADQDTFNTAIGSLPASGGSVVLLEGNYILSDKVAIGISNVTLRGQGKGTKLYLANGIQTNLIEVTGVSGVAIDNMYLDGTTAAADAGSDTNQCGILFNNVDESKIMNCWIESNKRHGIHLYNGSKRNGVMSCACKSNTRVGILLNDCVEGNTIDCNTTQSNGYSGIVLTTSASSNTVSGNTNQGNSEAGIYLLASSNENTITGNTCHSNSYDGIRVKGSSDNTITGNTTQGNTQNGIVLVTSANGNSISSNIAQGNGINGIGVDAGTANTITGNVCISNTLVGIIVQLSSNTTIDGNIAYDNSEKGIKLWLGANNSTLSGNTCNGNAEEGIYIYSSDYNTITGNACNGNLQDGIELANNSKDNCVTGNACNGNRYHGIALFKVFNTTITGNTSSGNSQAGSGNYDNIYISDSSRHNNIQQNTCRAGTAVTKPRYGINVTAATCEGNMITNNDIYNDGFITGTFNDSGTGTVTSAGNRT